MDEYMEIFKKYIGKDRRTYTKTMFKVMGTLYRGSSNGRFTLEQGLEAVKKNKVMEV